MIVKNVHLLHRVNNIFITLPLIKIMSKIKILPVYPEFPLTFHSNKIALEYVGKKASMPPTGLATVLAMFPTESFELQRIVDLNVEPLTDKQIREADILATSTMVLQEDSHNKIIERAHAHGKKVLAGGPFPTSYPERNSRADYIVAGEAESSLPPFLEDLIKGNPKRFYPETKIKPDITKTPIPRWDLLDMKNYFSAAIQFSRGCPFDCEFCDITKLYGRTPRTKNSKQMITEIEAVYNTDHRGSLMIVDDNFMGNKTRVKEFLSELILWQKERGYPFSIFTEASMNLAWDSNKDLLEDMVKSRFNMVFLGIESLDSNALKKMNKTQNERIPQLEAVRRIQKAGLEVTAGFIIGSDNESPDSPNKLFNFVQESGILVAMPGLLTAIKGTDLYTRLQKEDRIKEDYNGNNTHQLHFNFTTQQPEAELIESYKTLIKNLYSPRNYYSRARILQKNLGPIKLKKRANHEGITAFRKLMLRLPFSRGGLEGVKYLAQTLLTNPRYFPEAVSHAIMFDHLKTITDETLKAGKYLPQVETLYQKFSRKLENTFSNQRITLQKKLDRVSHLAQNIYTKAENKYHRLHKDFRAEASQALNTLRDRISTKLKDYNLHPFQTPQETV